MVCLHLGGAHQMKPIYDWKKIQCSNLFFLFPHSLPFYLIIWFVYFSQHLQHWHSGQYRIPHSLVLRQEARLHLPVTGLCRRHRPPRNGQTGSGWLHPIWGRHWGHGQYEVIRTSSAPGGVHVVVILQWELIFTALFVKKSQCWYWGSTAKTKSLLEIQQIYVIPK